MMGYRTPNIDRIAKEGALFTDYYAQQSCTAGRAAFITGQSPIRTGLLKVGLPSAQHDLLTGGDDKRREFFCWTDDGDLAGLRRSCSSSSSTRASRCGNILSHRSVRRSS